MIFWISVCVGGVTEFAIRCLLISNCPFSKISGLSALMPSVEGNSYLNLNSIFLGFLLKNATLVRFQYFQQQQQDL